MGVVNSSKDRRGLQLLGVCLALIVATPVVGLLLERQQEHLDPLTGCTIGTQPNAETVVLFDLTDPIPATLRDEVAEYFRGLEATELHDNERVTLWTLSGAKEGALRRRFCRCRPTRTTNPLFGNELMIAARSESLFTAPLRQALADLPVRETAATTPLIEAVQQVSSQPEFAGRTCPRRLVLITNGEQNSATMSFYVHMVNFSTFKKSAAFNRVSADLRGVDVEMLYVPHGRWARTLDTSLQNFWQSYLQACGAASVRVRRL